MNFSGIDRKSLVGSALRAILDVVPREAVVPVLQGPLRGARWVVGSANHGCWLGSYEYRKQRLFAKVVSPGDYVIDVGANVGFYTLLAASLAGSHGRVVAIEPLSQNVDRLLRHVSLNCLDTVTVIHAAVGDHMGTTRFAVNAQSNSMGRISPSGVLEVRLVSLDGLSAKGSLGIPDVVKIDVEGAEFEVLQGAERLLTHVRPMLFLATHGEGVHKQCCELLRRWDYELSAIDPADDVMSTDELLARPR